MIAGILKGGPADRAGIRPGDILVSVNDKNITDSSGLLNLIAMLVPGQTAQIKLLRNDKAMLAAVKVDTRPRIQQPLTDQ